jgi:hypothetical protein
VYQQPGGEPPRQGRNLVMIFSIVAIVVIIAAVVTIVLLNRGSSEPVAQNTTPANSTSSSAPPATSKSGTSTSKAADSLQPRNPGWTVIKNDKAKLIYEVPPAWTPLPSGTLSPKTLPDATIYFPAALGNYQCEGKGYSRGGLGGGTIAKADPAQAATNIAKAFGADLYSSGTATVETTAPKTVTNMAGPNGKQLSGAQVDAFVTVTGNNCLATKGKVSVLVVDNGSDLSFLMVNGDMAGGPATPAPPSELDLQKIIDTTRGY